MQRSFRYQRQQVEIIEPGTKRGEWWQCQVAIDGIPSVPFDVHDADFRGFRTDELRNQFLARQAMSLIDSYGDGRQPRPVNAEQPGRC